MDTYVLDANDRVFFADTSELADQHIRIFWSVVKGLGLYPIFYKGLKNEHSNLTVAVEMRIDLSTSKVLCFYLGASTFDNNYALAFVADLVAKLEVTCLIYVSPDFDPKSLERYGISNSTTVVSDLAAFEARLQSDLGSLLTKPAIH